MSAIAKLTAKGQVTIPRQIRDALKVKAGDLLAWDVGPDGVAHVRRVQPLDLDYLRAAAGTLSEWTSPEDEEAFRDL